MNLSQISVYDLFFDHIILQQLVGYLFLELWVYYGLVDNDYSFLLHKNELNLVYVFQELMF